MRLCLCLLKIAVILSFVTISAKAQSFNVEPLQNIDFGKFTLSGTQGGTITVNSNGVANATQNITLLSQATTSAAQFLVTTNSLVPINITLLSSSIYMTNQNNQTVLMDPVLPDPKSFSISVISPKTVSIGGQLTLSNNSPGAYSGEIMIDFIANIE